jgi:hypothetical protein
MYNTSFKKAKWPPLGGVKNGFLLLFDPYIAFFYIQMLNQFFKALKMVSFGISHKPICITLVVKNTAKWPPSGQF